mmetsp:Transcript_30859/g.61097  ORF Transcript_30859/g.61097 Transcript_30859/m.61097 type:complete len:211 (+) Transcript_30859:416-1048(+)
MGHRYLFQQRVEVGLVHTLVLRPVILAPGMKGCLVDRIPVPIGLVNIPVLVGDAISPVVQQVHVFRGQTKVDGLGVSMWALRRQVRVPDVLRDALGLARFGNDRKSVLEGPLQEHVDRRHGRRRSVPHRGTVVAVVRGIFHTVGVVAVHHVRQKFRRPGQQMRVSVQEAPVGLDLDAVRPAIGQQVPPLRVHQGMHLDLVDHRHRTAGLS